MCRGMAVVDVLSDCDPKGRTAGAQLRSLPGRPQDIDDLVAEMAVQL